MRVVIYNQMFGLNGRSLLGNVLGHWAVHYQKNPEKVWARSDLNETIKLIEKTNADVVGVIEVLEGQERELIVKMKERGYNYFYLGRGHKTKYSHLYVTEMVFSRIKGEQVNLGKFPVTHELGGGGGLVHVKFPEFNFVLAHLGLPSKKYYKDQINFLRSKLNILEGKVILLADFNLSYKKIKGFSDFNLVSREIKTCSLTPFFNLFYNKDVDHIMVKDFECKKLGTISGRSDHKLIWADLE